MPFAPDMSGADSEDTQNLAIYLSKEFPEYSDAIHAARRLSNTQDIVLQQVVSGSIKSLISRPQNKPAHRATLEEQEDRVLQIAQNILGNISDEKWEQLAAKTDQSAEEYRRSVWARVVKTLRRED